MKNLGFYSTEKATYQLVWFKEKSPHVGYPIRLPQGIGVGDPLPEIELPVETDEEAKTLLIEEIKRIEKDGTLN
jgi:hypothetical protein